MRNADDARGKVALCAPLQLHLTSGMEVVACGVAWGALVCEWQPCRVHDTLIRDATQHTLRLVEAPVAMLVDGKRQELPKGAGFNVPHVGFVMTRQQWLQSAHTHS